MGLHISFKHPFGSHSLLGGAAKAAGSLAPLAGLIPGVGPLGAGALGALGKLVSGGGLGGAAVGGLEGIGGNLLAGGKFGSSGLSGLAGTIGKAISSPNMLGDQEDHLDLGKLLGAASGVAGIVGQGQQRKSAQNYANARTDQMNSLMSKILAPPSYGTPNLNQQSSATPGY